MPPPGTWIIEWQKTAQQGNNYCVIANQSADITALRAALRAVALRNAPAGAVVWQSIF